mmetsp:Transcript_27632/g.95553  ORF Transcript_27632/g.95553 Transcript_27632/m.95553 type:complete len:141 (-) Transcript_27632:184-606(-)
MTMQKAAQMALVVVVAAAAMASQVEARAAVELSFCNHETECAFGSCINNVCACDTGYTGARCDIVMGKCTDSDTCSHGKCDEATGMCLCEAGWGGSECDVELRELSSEYACPTDPCSCCPKSGPRCPCLCGGGWCPRCCH